MSNIDEEAKNNFTIEMRIFENYEKVKYEIIKVIDFLEHSGTAMGMCRIFNNQNHEFWYRVIKPWFQPERFGITHLWFPPYKKYIPHRIKVLKLALKDLERIKEEYGKILNVYSLAVVSWYALNVCVGLVCVQGFSRQCP